jgi:uncharacterized membrane protein YjjP (DUF1212 family)
MPDKTETYWQWMGRQLHLELRKKWRRTKRSDRALYKTIVAMLAQLFSSLTVTVVSNGGNTSISFSFALGLLITALFTLILGSTYSLYLDDVGLGNQRLSDKETD